MTRMVSLKTASHDLAELLDEVARTHEPVLLGEDGTPRGALIDPESLARFERYRARVREDAREAIERIQTCNAHEDPAEVERFVTEIVDAVRQERYEAGLHDATGRHRLESLD